MHKIGSKDWSHGAGPRRDPDKNWDFYLGGASYCYGYENIKRDYLATIALERPTINIITYFERNVRAHAAVLHTIYGGSALFPFFSSFVPFLFSFFKNAPTALLNAPYDARFFIETDSRTESRAKVSSSRIYFRGRRSRGERAKRLSYDINFAAR